jgi:hypothetical protein
VVCSDIEGYRQVVSPSGSRLLPPHDSAALAGTLEQLCRDRPLCRAMGQHNLVEARKYDWGNLAPQVREEYTLAVTQPTRSRPLLGRRWALYRSASQPHQVEPAARIEAAEERESASVMTAATAK